MMMTLMTPEAEDDRSEPSLQDYPDRQTSRAWLRSSVSDEALSADARTDFVRARMPAPQWLTNGYHPPSAASSVPRCQAAMRNQTKHQSRPAADLQNGGWHLLWQWVWSCRQ